jgi:hypothetical protein
VLFAEFCASWFVVTVPMGRLLKIVVVVGGDSVTGMGTITGFGRDRGRQ